jgi:hypothetical protein
MKSTHTSKLIRAVLYTGAALFITGAMTAQAASTFISFTVDMSPQIAAGTFTNGVDTIEAHGTFNGYGTFNLVQVGSTSVYTNTVNDTADTNGGQMQYKYVIDGVNWENIPTGGNRYALLPTNSGASLVLPTQFYGDSGPTNTNTVTFQVDLAEQITNGTFTNGESTVIVAGGGLNGWNSSSTSNLLTLNPSIATTNMYGVVSHDVYVGTFPVAGPQAGEQAFKYVIQNGTIDWEAPGPVNSDNGGNRFFNNVVLTLPIVYFSDSPLGPPVNVGFSVDMSAVALSGNWQPSTVRLDGSFNGWATDVFCTNTNSANTNLFYATIPIGSFTAVQYQFRYTDTNGNTQYDHDPLGNNRAYTVPPNITSTNLPTVYFNNVLPTDVLDQDTTVIFTVDMTNAVAAPGSSDAGHHFDASVDSVFINGDFLGWLNWDPISLSAEQMTAIGSTSNYTYSVLFSKGHSRLLNYKYGMNGADDEAPSGQNHLRYIRSTGGGTYQMPVDIFGTQTIEPKIGGLTIGNPSGSNIPVSWLPYPTALLQSTTNLTIPNVNGAIWTDDSATLGQGSTNWPVSGGSVFFRLKGI